MIVQLHLTTRPTSAFRNDRLAAFNDSTDLNFPQRLSSCIQQLDRPQLPATIVQLHLTTRPTSATRNDRPAASYDSTDLSFPLRSSSCILRLDRSQLPATIVQLYSTTQPTATRIKHLAVSQRLDLRQLPSSNIQLRISTTRPYQLSTSPIPAIDITHRTLYTRL